MKCSKIPFFLISAIMLSCGGSNDKQAGKDSAVIKKQTALPDKPATPGKKPPILNIIDTVSVKRIVVCMRDSAANDERLSAKLANIYGTQLAEVFKKEKLNVTGAPMAWFRNKKAPYFFEAGLPVNKKPAKMPKGVFIRETYADSVVVAHFFGPYELIPQGYAAVKEWMKETKRNMKGIPFEIYITDPFDKKGKPLDPYKVQTDIVFPKR